MKGKESTGHGKGQRDERDVYGKNPDEERGNVPETGRQKIWGSTKGEKELEEDISSIIVITNGNVLKNLMDTGSSQKFIHVAWEDVECRTFLYIYGYEIQIVL